MHPGFEQAPHSCSAGSLATWHLRRTGSPPVQQPEGQVQPLLDGGPADKDQQEAKCEHRHAAPCSQRLK